MSNRSQWGSRMGFIMAAVGSAIGLGNIWRFPYTLASNGGGAFLIPYFIALITAGIPILILEFSLGHKLKSTAPGVFAKLNKKWQILGWWQTAIAFAITVYYMVIIAWAANYAIYSLDLSWGKETGEFFYNQFLGDSGSPLVLGGMRYNILVPLVLVWVANFAVLILGIKDGIERASKVFMPLLIVTLIIITIRGLTLPGALDGLEYLFKPDFTKIFDGKVWVAAYGQIFYSLSICFGIMLAYSSYLPKKTDIVNNAFITAFGNCSFSLLAGIAVFSILGYMANIQNSTVQEVTDKGVGLAFVVFPKAMNDLPSFNNIFGALFFICLVFAGLSSTMSLIETFVSAISDKFSIGRKKSLLICCSFGLLISLVYATGAGLRILDLVDHYINTYCVAIAGLIEVIIIGWFVNLEGIRKYANPMSDFSVGRWWNICIKYVTPIILGIMIIQNTLTDIFIPYGEYQLLAQFSIGLGMVALTIILGIAFNAFSGSEHFKQVISEGVNRNEF